MISGLWIAAADERADARRSCSRRNPPVPSLGWQSSGAPDDWHPMRADLLGIEKSAWLATPSPKYYLRGS